MKKKNNVVVCFFGDAPPTKGASMKGSNWLLWEAAGDLLLREHLYGMSVPTSKSMNIKNVAERAAATA
jgi:TPP-dependent pyruvate/acetoin dehydrogenase alpha subunit